MKLLHYLIGILFSLCYLYPLFLQLRGAFAPKRALPKKNQTRRYGILIAARNEEAVIGHLLKSIREQDYPARLLRVFVVADNCTDCTAAAAREAGANVFVRKDPERPGKGYALHWLLEQIKGAEALSQYDGFFVFDADNLLSRNFITEMDKALTDDRPVVTGCRNSKNFGDSWVSAGQAVWFLRGSQLNHGRARQNTNCLISGTGFLFSSSLLEQSGGWRFFLLTEDAEFNAFHTAKGVRIGYCPTAVFYDEQPVTLPQSLRQRRRWARGSSQVLGRYGRRLLCGQNRLSCWDLLTALLPAAGLTAAGVCLGLLELLSRLGTDRFLPFALMTALRGLILGYLAFFPVGLLAILPNWNQIKAGRRAKLQGLFAFPLFMMTFTPAALAALLPGTGWKPIHHGAAVSLEEMQKETV